MKGALAPLVGWRSGVTVRKVHRSFGDGPRPWTSRVGSRVTTSQQALAEGVVMTGSTDAEHTWTEKAGNDRSNRPTGGPHVQYQGEIILTNVRALVAMGPGERMPYSTLLLEPAAFGGRVAQLAETYTFHRIRKIELTYVPSCPADTSGAISVYLQPDIGVPALVVGQDEQEHAAQEGTNFVSSSVWKGWTKSFDVPAMVNEFTSSSEDAYLQAQGLLIVETASDLAAASYGTIYMRYDVEFFGQELDYDVDPNPTHIGVLQFNAVPMSSGDALMLPTGALSPAPGAASFNASNSPDSPAVVMYGEILSVSGGAPDFLIGDDNQRYDLARGQVLFMGFADTSGEANWSDGTIYVAFYTDYASADSSALAPGEPAIQDSDKGLLRFADAGTYSFSINFTLRSLPSDPT